MLLLLWDSQIFNYLAMFMPTFWREHFRGKIHTREHTISGFY